MATLERLPLTGRLLRYVLSKRPARTRARSRRVTGLGAGPA